MEFFVAGSQQKVQEDLQLQDPKRLPWPHSFPAPGRDRSENFQRVVFGKFAAQLGPCQPPEIQLTIPKQSRRFPCPCPSPIITDALLFPLSSDYPPSGMVSPEQAQCRGLFPHGLQRYHTLPAAEGNPGNVQAFPVPSFAEVLRFSGCCLFPNSCQRGGIPRSGKDL